MVLESLVRTFRCRLLVTLRGPNRGRVREELNSVATIDDGAVVVFQGRIQDVGTWADVRPHVASIHVQDFDGIITPGLVDAHTHAVFADHRAHEFESRCMGKSYQEIAALGGGIKSSMHSVRAATFDELFTATERHLAWMMACGTTTIECKSGYGLSVEAELKMLQVIKAINKSGVKAPEIVPTFLGAHAIPPEFSGDKSLYMENVIHEQLPAAASLCEFVDIFVENGYFDEEDAAKLAHASRSRGLKFKLHVDQLTNSQGAALAARLGAETADHLEHSDSEGIELLAKGGVTPVLLPASVYCLGLTQYPNARQMIQAGLPIVLATDFNPGSSPSPSLPFAMSLGCTQLKLSPAEALTACTVNAAHAIGRPDRGSIESGKRADFALWNVRDWREIPYWVGAPLTHGVIIGGE